jgi:chromosome segregation ATPase
MAKKEEAAAAVTEHKHADLEKELAALKKELESVKKELESVKKSKSSGGGADPRVDKLIEALRDESPRFKNCIEKANL